MKRAGKDEPIMLKEQIEVDAALMVVPHLRNTQVTGEVDFSKARHATAADLDELGYRHQDRARERAIELFHLMHLEYDSDDDRICVLRYFVEMITVYDHAPDQDSLDSLHALITGVGAVGGDMKRAMDYEQSLGNGRVIIYEGHPCYCSNTEPHEPHRFEYLYLDGNGNRVEGFYDCDGAPTRLATR